MLFCSKTTKHLSMRCPASSGKFLSKRSHTILHRENARQQGPLYDVFNAVHFCDNNEQKINVVTVSEGQLVSILLRFKGDAKSAQWFCDSVTLIFSQEIVCCI